MGKNRICELCQRTHYKHSAVLKCERQNKHKMYQIELSVSESESILGETHNIEEAITNSYKIISNLNHQLEDICNQQNSIKKKIKKMETCRQKMQILNGVNVQSVQPLDENLIIDLDSVRIMVMTTQLSVLSKRMRLSRTFAKHKDDDCKNWFMIVDEPFFISIPPEKT